MTGAPDESELTVGRPSDSEVLQTHFQTFPGVKAGASFHLHAINDIISS